MERRGFKLYTKFNKRDGLPLSRYEKVLKAYGLDTNKDDLRFYMDRAINLGFAEKRARRYRMPWKLCDYHIARTLGVRGLPVPKARAISTETVEDKTTSTSSLSSSHGVIENSNAKRNNKNDTTSAKNNQEEEEVELELAKIKLESNEMPRSSHYLITDYWKGMESFFGILETEEQRNIRGNFALPVTPKMWTLGTEPESQQEEMWTYEEPRTDTAPCEQEDIDGKTL